MSDRVKRIETCLRGALTPTALTITDDSHKHAGHPGARDGRGHFSVDIVSHAFDGMGRLARHRAVYAALGTLLDTDIHALAIQAATPAEADS